MSSVQVVVYDVVGGPLLEARSYYFRNDSEQPPVVETNVHFLAKFTPAKLSFFRFNLEDLQDIEPAIVETNPHFVASFKPAVFTSFRFNGFENLFSSAHVVSTVDLQLPINAVLIGQQLFAEEKPNAFGPGKVGRLSKNAPSFTVTTTKKGYD